MQIPGSEELREFLFSLLTEEDKQRARFGKKVIDHKKMEAFEQLFGWLLENAVETGTRIRADRFHPFPLSGFIAVTGERIKLTPLVDMETAFKEVSNLEVSSNGEEVMLILTFNGMANYEL